MLTNPTSSGQRGRSLKAPSSSGTGRRRVSVNRESAILSMPKDTFKPTQLFETSPVSKLQTFEVELKMTGDQFLMKSIKNERCASSKLKQELAKLQTMDHPGLPRVEHVQYTANYSYIIYEKPPGGVLWKESQVQQYPEDTVRAVAYQLARVMQYCHAVGIVHRDLRPANVIVDFPKKSSRPQVTLADFRISKALHPDERLAILDDGSAFLSAHVRKELGQYPAPEVLMDLKYDRSVDSWFLGTFLYLLISGNVPFPGNTNEQLKESILYHHIEFVDDAWLKVSASLDEIITGLLQKDPKQRWPIDKILWNKWIRKFHYPNMVQLILTNWLRKAKKQVTYRVMESLNAFAAFGLSVLDSRLDREWRMLQRESARKRGKKRDMHRVHTFRDRKEQYVPLVVLSRSNTRVLHQAKVWTFNGKQASVNPASFVTVAANVWVGNDSDPMTFEYTFNYVKNDVFIGIVSDDYEAPKDSDLASRNHIGMNDCSIGISLRECAAYYDGKRISHLSRNASFNNRVAKFKHVARKFGRTAVNGKESSEDDDDVFNFEFDKTAASPKEYYGIRGANPEMKMDRYVSGPVPYRKLSVKMRVDCLSKTLSVMVNGEVLDPLYFEFPGYVTSAVTLCHCLDQITLENVAMDLT